MKILLIGVACLVFVLGITAEIRLISTDTTLSLGAAGVIIKGGEVVDVPGAANPTLLHDATGAALLNDSTGAVLLNDHN